VDDAVFTNSQTARSVSTAVQIEPGLKKFPFSAVDSTKDRGERRNAIELGASTTKPAAR
jgi:hypothetical protein